MERPRQRQRRRRPPRDPEAVIRELTDLRIGAPVVHEDNPTLENLVGRIEYRSELGSLVTDFTLIRAGALHRAVGLPAAASARLQ